MMGATLPLPVTASERTRDADPRAALAERYRDREDYMAQALAAARHLVEEGFLLEEDVQLAVDLAAQRYDLVVAPSLVAT
jgi:hypothetical protein